MRSYNADGRYIHSWDGTNVGTNALDFGENTHVTAMSVHDGVIWAAVAPVARGDLVIPTWCLSAFSWDGIQDSWDAEIPLEQPVYGLFSLAMAPCTLAPFRSFQVFGSGVASIRRVPASQRRGVAFDGDDIFMLDQRSDGTFCYTSLVHQSLEGQKAFPSVQQQHIVRAISSRQMAQAVSPSQRTETLRPLVLSACRLAKTKLIYGFIRNVEIGLSHFSQEIALL